MRNSIISLGTLVLLAMIVPMLALPVFAVVGANGGIGTDAPKVGTGQNGGSNVVSHGPGGEHQDRNGANAPNSNKNGANANAPSGTCGTCG
jgi:hypothetical protein